MKRITYTLPHGILISCMLFAIAFGASILLTVSDHVQVAEAQGQQENVPCDPGGYVVAFKQELVKYQQSPEPSPKGRGLWYSEAETINFEITGNELVCLSSTPDGRGSLRVDDKLEVFVTDPNGIQRTFTHDFYKPITPERGEIGDWPAQNITAKFGRGRPHVIRIKLWDFFAPVYMNDPIWLVVLVRPTPTPTPTRTFTPTPTDTFTPTPTRTFTPTPTSTLTPTPKPTATLTPTPPVPADIENFSVPSGFKVGLPPLDQWLQYMFARAEQGQPFPIDPQIIPRPSIQQLTVTASVTDGDGEVIIKGIELTRERRTNIYVGQVPAIAQTGTYSLTLHVEGIDSTGNRGNLDETVSFVVGWPFWTRPIRGLVALLVIYLLYLIMVKPLLVWLFLRDLGKRLVIGEMHIKWPPEKKDLSWNLSGSYLAEELSMGIDSGDIALPSLSHDAAAPRGIFGKLIGNLENRRRQVAPLVVSTVEQVPVLVNGEPAPIEKRGPIWSAIRFIAPLPRKRQGIALSSGSVIELGGYNLEYTLKEEI